MPDRQEDVSGAFVRCYNQTVMPEFTHVEAQSREGELSLGGMGPSTGVRSIKSASVILFISPNFPSVSSLPERSAQSEDFKPDVGGVGLIRHASWMYG